MTPHPSPSAHALPKQNAVCTPNGECGLGEFIEAEATDSSDIVCGKCGTCEVGTVPATKCTPTLGGDTKCQSCDTGIDFAARQGQEACTPISKCKNGEYVISAATASSDTVCDRCPGGTKAVAAENLATACTACPSGSYSSAGSTSCGACPAGTADLDNDPATSCVTCQPGTYQDAEGMTKCQKWSECPAGEEESIRPTQYFDAECRACVLGTTFKARAGAGLCVPVTPCDEGMVEFTVPTLTSDRKSVG